MKLLTNPIALAIVSVVLIFASFRVGKRFGSPTIAPTDTVFVDRQLTKRDTIRVIQPKEVKVFRTVTETRVDTIHVPVNLTPVGVVGAQPITRTKGNALTLTTFDLGRQAWTQQTFTLPPQQWGIGLFAVSAVGRLESKISIQMRVRYQKVEISPFIGVSASLGANPQLDYGASMSYKLF